MSLSLKQGLWLIVLAALLPITFMSIWQSVTSWNRMQQSAMTSLHANAKAVAERERGTFLVTSRLLMVAAANPDVRDMTTQCNVVLRNGFQGFDPIINFIRTDATGAVKCSILPFRKGVTLRDEAWWQDTSRSTSITVSAPMMGSISGVKIIVMAMPVYDAQKRFAGTVSSGLDISKLTKTLNAAPEAKTGFIAVSLRSGDLVVGSRAIPFKLPSTLRDGLSGTAISTAGEPWIYKAVSISDDDLYVIYAEPRETLMAAARAQFTTSMLLPLAVIIMTLGAIWIGTNRLVVRWLAALRGLSADLMKGKFAPNRQAFADAPLELRELSDDLHDMAQVIETRTADLTQALDAKSELTREVHHRVKNNLQIVTSLLTMQAARMKDSGAQAALKQARARIVALALIHRLTYEQESMGSESQVTVETLIAELTKQLRYAHRDRRTIDLSYEADAYAMPVDMAVPFALFIVEAVTNSFRHAFPDDAAGEIALSFSLDNGHARLVILDNGQGYEIDNPAVGQMGTELMEGFASQLNGSVTFSSDRQNGSATTLLFPTQLDSYEQSTGPLPA